MDWGSKWLVDFNAGKTQLVLFDWSSNTGAIDVKMDGSSLEEKSSIKKIGVLICSMKFLSAEVALYLFKSTIQPYMEYCFHVWAGTSSWYFELLDKLQKRICKSVGPSLTASLASLSKCSQLKSFLEVLRW